MKIKDTEKDVRHILKKYPVTRCDDAELYSMYCQYKTRGLDYDWRWLFVEASINPRFRWSHGLATYETVARARRKLQARCKTLRPSEEIINARKEMEKEYRKYAREMA